MKVKIAAQFNPKTAEAIAKNDETKGVKPKNTSKLMLAAARKSLQTLFTFIWCLLCVAV